MGFLLNFIKIALNVPSERYSKANHTAIGVHVGKNVLMNNFIESVFIYELFKSIYNNWLYSYNDLIVIVFVILTCSSQLNLDIFNN